MSVDLAQQWLSHLEGQANEALRGNEMERYQDISALTKLLRGWIERGAQGTHPVSPDQYHRLKLIPPASLLAASPLITPPPDPLQSPIELGTHGATGLTDAEREKTYNQAVALLRDGGTTRALRILRELASEPQGSLRDPILATLREATLQQQQIEQAALDEAIQITQKFPGDLERQRGAWQKVRGEAEEGGEASRQADQAIARITQEQNRTLEEIRVRGGLTRINNEIKTAVKRADITGLQALLTQLDALLSDTLSVELMEQVSTAITSAHANLDELKLATGLVRTLIQSGDYEVAYKTIVDQVKRGVTEIWDTQAQANRSAEAIKNETQQLLVEYRRNKAIERLSLARTARSTGVPARALEYYNEALALLTYLDLQSENRDGRLIIVGGSNKLPIAEAVDIRSELETIQTELDDSRELLRLWQDGNTKFQKVEAEANPLNALRALRAIAASRSQHANLHFAGLDEAIAQREQDLNATLVVMLQTACTNAKSFMAGHDFKAARQLLTEARGRLGDVRTPSEALTQAHKQLDSLLEDVQAHEIRAGKVAMFLAAALQAVTEQPPDLERAQAQLSMLTVDEKADARAVDVQRRIAALQDANTNWAAAQLAYSKNDWRSVIELCKPIIAGGGPHSANAAIFNGRATASVAFEDAQTAIKHAPPNYATAQANFAQVLALLEQFGRDEQTLHTYHEAKEALQKIKDMSRGDSQVRPALTRLQEQIAATKRAAQRDLDATPPNLAVRPEWKEFAAILTELQTQPSTLDAEITRVELELFEAWRTDYLGRISRSSEPRTVFTLGLLYRLVAELYAAGLLWESDEKRRARELELNYMLLQANELRHQNRINWSQVIKVEERALELLQLGYLPDPVLALDETTITTRVHEARIHELRTEVERLLAADNAVAAVSKLEREITSERFRDDLDLTGELIKLHLQLAQFDQARRWARNLRFANAPNATQTSGLWNELIKGVEYFKIGDFPEALNQITFTEQRYPEGQAQIAAVLAEYVEATVSILVAQALDCRRKNDLLGALQAFGQAHVLLAKTERDDMRVARGLNELRDEVARVIDGEYSSADNLRLGGREPEQTLEEGRRIRARLRTIQGVKEPLGLNSGQQQVLALALNDLERRMAQWESALATLQKARDLCEQARRQGWNFAESRRLTQELRRFPEFREFTRPLEDQVESYERWVEQLQPPILDLAQAIQEEKFERTIEFCGKISMLWSKMKRALLLPLSDSSLSGQSAMRHYYSHLQKNENELSRHRQIAEELRANYEQWRDHAQRLKSADQRVRRLHGEIKQALNARSKTLSEIKQALTHLQQELAELNTAIAQTTDLEEPMSAVAEEQQQQAERVQPPPKQKVELAVWSQDSTTWLHEIEAQERTFNDKLKEIRAILRDSKRPATTRNVEMVGRMLQEATTIDPLDELQLPTILDDFERWKQRGIPKTRWWS